MVEFVALSLVVIAGLIVSNMLLATAVYFQYKAFKVLMEELKSERDN